MPFRSVSCPCHSNFLLPFLWTKGISRKAHVCQPPGDLQMCFFTKRQQSAFWCLEVRKRGGVAPGTVPARHPKSTLRKALLWNSDIFLVDFASLRFVVWLFGPWPTYKTFIVSLRGYNAPREFNAECTFLLGCCCRQWPLRTTTRMETCAKQEHKRNRKTIIIGGVLGSE